MLCMEDYPELLAGRCLLYLGTATFFWEGLLSDDYTASTATTGFVAVGGSITGSIETTGDVDWIKVTLVAGTTYQFDVYGLGSGEGTLAASAFGLRDSSGQPITPFVTSGGPPGGAEFTYTALSSGDYFIHEHALSSQQLGTYKITVAQIDSPVAAADTASITEDTAPNPVVGNVLANDQDADGDTLTVANAGDLQPRSRHLGSQGRRQLRLHPG